VTRIQIAVLIVIWRNRFNVEIAFHITTKMRFDQLKNLANVGVSSRIGPILIHQSLRLLHVLYRNLSFARSPSKKVSFCGSFIFPNGLRKKRPPCRGHTISPLLWGKSFLAASKTNKLQMPSSSRLLRFPTSVKLQGLVSPIPWNHFLYHCSL